MGNLLRMLVQLYLLKKYKDSDNDNIEEFKNINSVHFDLLKTLGLPEVISQEEGYEIDISSLFEEEKEEEEQEEEAKEAANQSPTESEESEESTLTTESEESAESTLTQDDKDLEITQHIISHTNNETQVLKFKTNTPGKVYTDLNRDVIKEVNENEIDIELELNYKEDKKLKYGNYTNKKIYLENNSGNVLAEKNINDFSIYKRLEISIVTQDEVLTYDNNKETIEIYNIDYSKPIQIRFGFPQATNNDVLNHTFITVTDTNDNKIDKEYNDETSITIRIPENTANLNIIYIDGQGTEPFKTKVLLNKKETEIRSDLIELPNITEKKIIEKKLKEVVNNETEYLYWRLLADIRDIDTLNSDMKDEKLYFYYSKEQVNSIESALKIDKKYNFQLLKYVAELNKWQIYGYIRLDLINGIEQIGLWSEEQYKDLSEQKYYDYIMPSVPNVSIPGSNLESDVNNANKKLKEKLDEDNNGDNLGDALKLSLDVKIAKIAAEKAKRKQLAQKRINDIMKKNLEAQKKEKAANKALDQANKAKDEAEKAAEKDSNNKEKKEKAEQTKKEYEKLKALIEANKSELEKQITSDKEKGKIEIDFLNDMLKKIDENENTEVENSKQEIDNENNSIK